jgi:hypothetical protein
MIRWPNELWEPRMHLFIKLILQFDGNLVFANSLPEADSLRLCRLM